MAIEEGYFTLEDTLQDIFPDKLTALARLTQKPVTVKNLLCMSTGVFFNEAATVLEEDWVRAFLESDCAFQPGTDFAYNSLNTYLLSAVIKRKTGQGLLQFLTPRLLEPLGIPSPEWCQCPKGIEKGGWGLSMTLQDIAKLGQLYLQRGIWQVEGQRVRLLPEWWVKEATKKQMDTIDPPVGYGYQMWMFPLPGAYQFNGIFGQYVVVLPQQDMVVALLGGNESLFPTGGVADLIAETFGQYKGPAVPIARDNKGYQSLKSTLQGLTLGKRSPAYPSLPLRSRLAKRIRPDSAHYTAAASPPPALFALNGKTFALDRPNTAGMVPLVQQCVRNSFTSGIEYIRFDWNNGALLVTVTEGKEINLYPAGLDEKARYSTVTVRGESYAVASVARILEDEGGRIELHLTVTFVETPCSRIIRCRIEGNHASFHFTETPAAFGAAKALSGMVNAGRPIQERVVDNFLAGNAVKLRRVLTPTVLARALPSRG